MHLELSGRAKLACITALTAGLGLFTSLAAQTQPQRGSAFTKLRPARIALPALKKDLITQFLGADRKGRVFLLRGDTLEVFRLRGTDLDPAGKLACRTRQEPAYAAAMDPAGSTWAVSATAFDLALCDSTEQKRPAGLVGLVSSIAFSGTGPLVAVVPIGGGRPDLARPVNPRVPRVLSLEGSRWQPVSWALLPEVEDPAKGVMTQIKAQTDRLICTGPKRSMWLASWNAYRVEEVSAAVEPKRTLVVGSGKIQWSKPTEQERKELDAQLRKRGLDPAKNRGGHASPQDVIRAMLCGTDGLIYLFVTTGEGMALDRFDPAQSTLDRVLLDGVKVGEGPMTAVFANEEIVFGGRLTEHGIWRLSVADLESAAWQEVTGARLNGKAIN